MKSRAEMAVDNIASAVDFIKNDVNEQFGNWEETVIAEDLRVIERSLAVLREEQR